MAKRDPRKRPYGGARLVVVRGRSSHLVGVPFLAATVGPAAVRGRRRARPSLADGNVGPTFPKLSWGSGVLGPVPIFARRRGRIPGVRSARSLVSLVQRAGPGFRRGRLHAPDSAQAGRQRTRFVRAMEPRGSRESPTGHPRAPDRVVVGKHCRRPPHAWRHRQRSLLLRANGHRPGGDWLPTARISPRRAGPRAGAAYLAHGTHWLSSPLYRESLADDVACRVASVDGSPVLDGRNTRALLYRSVDECACAGRDLVPGERGAARSTARDPLDGRCADLCPGGNVPGRVGAHPGAYGRCRRAALYHAHLVARVARAA